MLISFIRFARRRGAPLASEAFVLDASAAVKWYLPDEEHTEIAAALLDRFVDGKTDLVAPAYIRYEAAAVLSFFSLRQPPRLTRESGWRGIAAFSRLAIPTLGADDLIEEAYPLVRQYGIALYDALYLALAIRLPLPVITADAQFYRRVEETGLALWLGDWRSRSGI